jgi:hypothetical protein
LIYSFSPLVGSAGFTNLFDFSDIDSVMISMIHS